MIERLIRLCVLVAIFGLPVPGVGVCQPQTSDPQVIPLWPEGVPGAKPGGGEERLVDGRVSNVHVPTLTHHAPGAGMAVGTAVIVCPGGGYVRLAMTNEAAGVTGPLNRAGVTVFVLKYRLVEYGHPAPLQDVLRAIRLVRARAAEFGVRRSA